MSRPSTREAREQRAPSCAGGGGAHERGSLGEPSGRPGELGHARLWAGSAGAQAGRGGAVTSAAGAHQYLKSSSRVLLFPGSRMQVTCARSCPFGAGNCYFLRHSVSQAWQQAVLGVFGARHEKVEWVQQAS